MIIILWETIRSDMFVKCTKNKKINVGVEHQVFHVAQPLCKTAIDTFLFERFSSSEFMNILS